MRTKIINIGNSKGIIIPAYILKECNIKEEVEMVMSNGDIIIKPLKKIRDKWDELFKDMNKNKQDNLLIGDVELNEDDWEW